MTHDVRLFGAIAVRPAVLPLIPQFESATGHAVMCKWELNPAVKRQIEAGEPFDLVITNPNLVQDLAILGKIRPGSQLRFGRISMGVAAKAGGGWPGIGSIEEFIGVLKNASSIAYSNEGTSGGYFSGLLERLGIADEIRPKLVTTSGGQTASAVARDEAEIAVVPIASILAAAPEVMLVGRFPTELHSYIDFDMGVSVDSAEAEPAVQLAHFLRSAAVDDALASRGVERR